jgi:hypothetical protein
MEALEQAPCGGIGPCALTHAELAALHDRGEVAEDHGNYDAMLTAWRYLETALQAEEPTQ